MEMQRYHSKATDNLGWVQASTASLSKALIIDTSTDALVETAAAEVAALRASRAYLGAALLPASFLLDPHEQARAEQRPAIIMNRRPHLQPPHHQRPYSRR